MLGMGHASDIPLKLTEESFQPEQYLHMLFSLQEPMKKHLMTTAMASYLLPFSPAVPGHILFSMDIMLWCSHLWIAGVSD